MCGAFFQPTGAGSPPNDDSALIGPSPVARPPYTPPDVSPFEFGWDEDICFHTNSATPSFVRERRGRTFAGEPCTTNGFAQ